MQPVLAFTAMNAQCCSQGGQGSIQQGICSTVLGLLKAVKDTLNPLLTHFPLPPQNLLALVKGHTQTGHAALLGREP